MKNEECRVQNRQSLGLLFSINQVPSELIDPSVLHPLLDSRVTKKERQKSFALNSVADPEQRDLHEAFRRRIQSRLQGIHPTPTLGPPLTHFVNELLEADFLALLAPDEGFNFLHLFWTK